MAFVNSLQGSQVKILIWMTNYVPVCLLSLMMMKTKSKHLLKQISVTCEWTSQRHFTYLILVLEGIWKVKGNILVVPLHVFA